MLNQTQTWTEDAIVITEILPASSLDIKGHWDIVYNDCYIILPI